MIREEINQSWVTLALTDMEALQAIFLAMSLKKAATTRKVWIAISESVTANMKYLLLQVFHGIVRISNGELRVAALQGAGWDSISKFWCWRLHQYEKCVFLNPNYLVKENCDELFKYDELSALPDTKMVDQFDTSCFVFKPSSDTFEKLLNLAGTIGNGKEPEVLNEFFKDWKPLDGRHMTSISIDDLSNDQYRVEFYSEFIDSFFKDQQDESIQTFISEMMETSNFPRISPCLTGTKQADNEDTIAVIGMSCRFPGANNTAEYWKLLAEGREAIRRFPSDRPFTGPQEAREMQAGFLNCPVDEFDAKFFGISPREAALVDPQQRLLLEVTWECLENAGINPQTLRESDTGVYVGLWQQDYERIIMESKRAEEDKGTTDFLHVFLGNKYSATASRISFCLGLNGPAIAVESGCSSSLTGLHLACESLYKGETSLALVSGVNLILLPFNPFSGKAADENGVVLSRDYRCKTFDESADGFVRAEACGVVALKRFKDARRDGDNILALIKGTAINNDGSGTSFGTPNEKAQEKVYRAALKRAKLSPAEVSYVEAHGTGTVVGDPIEMYAVGQAYSEGRTEPLLVGSVKTNIGHCEAAAGIASLIKVILCIQNEAIPPHLNLKTLNPRINLESIPAIIPMELTPWKASTKIAAISSFSMSATNAHAIVQQPPKPIPSHDNKGTVQMVTISAKSEEALADLTKRYIDFLKSNGNASLSDIAYSANTGRARLQHRLAVVASDTTQLLCRLEKQNVTQGKASTLKSKVAFLFTGQGSQYIGMTRGLYEAFPAFQIAMDRCGAIFQKSLNESLQNVIFSNEELLSQTLYCQPAIFCIEYCLFQLWSHFGIKPDCVLGHSVGEFAAAVAAGLLTLEDAMKLVVARSQLVNKLSVGSMLAVRAPEEEVALLIKQFTKAHQGNADMYVDIAAINSSEEVVVSGNLSCVKQFQEFCLNNGVKYVNIHASHAFHSQAMDPVLAEFGKIAETTSIEKPSCTYVSGTLAKAMDPMEFGSEYWQRHLRDTVRFSHAIKVVWSECKVLVEIGSQPILLGLAMANIEDSTNGTGIFCPSQRRNEEPTTSFYTAMKKLYVSGVDFDWASVYGIRQKSVILPTYPFQRQRYWIADDVEKEEEMNPLLHPLLGKQFHSPLAEMIFYQTFRLKELNYIEDHKVAEFVVVPAAALLESFMAAGREVLQGGARNKFTITIENFVVEAVLPLENRCNIQTLVKSENQNSDKDALKYQLTLSRKLEQHFDKWKNHATAEFRPSSKLPDEKGLDLDTLKAKLEHKKSLESSYKTLADIGIQFGPKFQSIVSAWYSSTEILAEINLPADSEDYICHPIVLDAMIQACAFREYLSQSPGTGEAKNELFLPISIRKFTWLTKSMSSTLLAHSSGDSGTVTLYNSDGEKLAIMEGLELLKTTVNSVTRAIRADSLEVPEFLVEKWRSALGKMDSRLDMSRMIAPTLDSPTVSANKDTMEDVEIEDLKTLVQIVHTNTFLSFLIAIQECGWTWPAPGQILSVAAWKALLPNSMNEGIIQIYMNDLEVRGYLSATEPQAFTVLQELPSIVECDRIFEENRLRVLHTKSSSTRDRQFSLAFLDRYRTCLTQILQGKLTPLAYLFPEDEAGTEHGTEWVYTQSFFYNHLNNLVAAYFHDAIVNYRDIQSRDGVIRILEVGAGSGSSSAYCIDVLKKLNIPYHYTFTDISPLFLKDAKKKLGQGPEMSYQIFDIEKDPLSQGFSPEEFDVVIGVQVVHATVSIDDSVQNLKKVLRLNGPLILGEGFSAGTMHTFIYGMLDGWWRFKDYRLNSKLTALLDEEQWAECLERLEFDSVSSTPGIFLGVVAARNAAICKSETNKLVAATKKWLVVKDSSQICIATLESLQAHDRKVIDVSDPTFEYYCNILSAEAASLEGLICFCSEFQTGSLQETQQKIVTSLLNLLRAYEANVEKYKVRPKIVVVTRGVYSIGDTELGNPSGATAWGMMNVFYNENHNTRMSVIDLGPRVSSYEPSQVFTHIWNSNDELYVAFRENKTFVLRCNYLDKPPLPIQLPNTDRFKFLNPESGAFTDIEIRPAPELEPNEDDVEIEVRACALNFRDLFMVMKPEGFSLPDDQSAGTLDSVGLDIAGVVSSIGSKVSRFQVGDEVFGFARSGALGTHTLAAENTVMRIPKNMTFVEASTIPCAFMTVIVSLVHVAKITPADRVLIHVASGGVGLAAVQVVKSVGCEIFATAGNKRKRAYLRNLGIKYVYHSRNTSYGEGIERDTNGLGVTVVLNSLTNPNFKETSLKVCSQGARFVEIAKMNIWQPEEVQILRPDVKYTIVDLSVKESIKEGNSEREADSEDHTRTIEQLVAAGTYTGLPCVTYPLSKVRDAFYYFQKAKHIGKIVIEIPQRTKSEAGRFEHKHYIFNSKSSYMITGGLGGIGIEVTKWMQTVGAKTIILVGRSKPADNVQRLIEEWNRQGSNIVVFQTDIADYDNCERLLELIKYLDMPPLRGIFHAAGVISDAVVSKQTVENFEHVLRPKVYGGWFLHLLTLQYQMEFFVMFSSLSGIVGMLGQCNHSAANRFLDSLTHYRVSMGLPGKTINWGGWSDVGAAATIGLTTEVFSGMRMFTPAQGIAALEKIMTSHDTQTGVSEVVDWNIVKNAFGQGRYMEEIKTDVPETNKFEQFDYLVEEIQQAVSMEERQLKIQVYIEAILKQTLSLPTTDVLDIDQHFNDLGVDSLMGMEMKNRFQSILGNRTLSISSMQENRTIRSLSAHLAHLMENEPLDTRPLDELLKEDVILPPEVIPAEIPCTIPSKFTNVLVTGATGHVGIHCLAQLLNSPQGLTVYCLIRGKSDADAQERLQKAMDRYQIAPETMDNVKVIAGDISKDKLGLSAENFELLANAIDGIMHFAAKVNHVDKYSDGSQHDMRTHNVHGLVNILKFASSHKTKSLLFASTLFSATKISDSGTLGEDYPDKEDMGQSISWGYLLSKFIAEKLIREAGERGIPVTTIRFPVIFGNSETGYMPTGYNHVWATILASIRVRMIPSGQLNGIPIIAVDSAAKVVTSLFLSDAAERGLYNMTVNSTLSEEILSNGVSEYGISCEFVPFQEWKDAVFEEQDAALMGPLKSLYQDENQESGIYSLHSLSKQTDQMNISTFSEKMLKNLPEVASLVASPELVVRRQLRAHFHTGNRAV